MEGTCYRATNPGRPLPSGAPITLTIFDTIGTGVAGLFCAGSTGQRGLDPQEQKHFMGQNPELCRSALSRHTPTDVIRLRRQPVPLIDCERDQRRGARSTRRLHRPRGH